MKAKLARFTYVVVLMNAVTFNLQVHRSGSPQQSFTTVVSELKTRKPSVESPPKVKILFYYIYNIKMNIILENYVLQLRTFQIHQLKTQDNKA